MGIPDRDRIVSTNPSGAVLVIPVKTGAMVLVAAEGRDTELRAACQDRVPWFQYHKSAHLCNNTSTIGVNPTAL